MDGQRMTASVFPGGVSVSHLRVYDDAASDGMRGGTPHAHAASSEAYLVLGGRGRVHTVSSSGFEDRELVGGAIMWFSPGSIHRLINVEDLELLVIMQNAGLPEAGDAVMTFPDEVLADPAEYAAHAALPSGDAHAVATAVRDRRDLALAGFQSIVDGLADGSWQRFHDRMASLLHERVPDWRGIWEESSHRGVAETERQLDALSQRDSGYLALASISSGSWRPGPRRFGMCGMLRTFAADDNPRP